MTAALWVELLKARRSKAPWLSLLAFALFPLVGGLFMVILRDPEWARRSGLITAKAQLAAGIADWPSYFDLLAQATAIGGFVLFGLIAIWVFGREYSDRTLSDLLALPTSRESIVLAKLAVVGLWSAGLTAFSLLLGLGVGAAIGLPGWSAALAISAAGDLARVAGLDLVLVTPLAWAASAGRGYLPPIGCMFLAIAFAQILVVLGWGAYFPWSVPALTLEMAGPDAQPVGAMSYLVVAFAGLLGAAGTLAWWRWADLTT